MRGVDKRVRMRESSVAHTSLCAYIGDISGCTRRVTESARIALPGLHFASCSVAGGSRMCLLSRGSHLVTRCFAQYTLRKYGRGGEESCGTKCDDRCLHFSSPEPEQFHLLGRVLERKDSNPEHSPLFRESRSSCDYCALSIRRIPCCIGAPYGAIKSPELLQGCEARPRGCGRRRVLKSSFDGWLMGKLVVQVDEVYEAGNWDLANKLKPLITEPTVSANIKYGPQLEIENYARFLMFSNHSAPLNIQEGDRRYFVVNSKAQ